MPQILPPDVPVQQTPEQQTPPEEDVNDINEPNVIEQTPPIPVQ